jgi:hypothetical protein
MTPAGQDSTVTPDLRVFSVTKDYLNKAVVISLYGGDQNACGSVRFEYDSNADLEAAVKKIKTWQEGNVAVALHQSPDTIALCPMKEPKGE